MKTTEMPRAVLPSYEFSTEDARPIGTPCSSDCRIPQGNVECHCSVCHRTVRGPSNFDLHRADGWCVDLEAMGYIEIDGIWASEDGHRQKMDYAGRMLRARAMRG